MDSRHRKTCAATGSARSPRPTRSPLHLSLLFAALTGALIGWSPSPCLAESASSPERREEPPPSEEASVEAESSLSFPVLPFLKLTSGVSIYPALESVARYDLDVLVGGRFELTHGRPGLELVPEVGYSYHNGDEVEGHYGVVGVGLRYGGVWFAGGTVTSLLLGARSGEFDLGVRAGLRFEALLGVLGLEITYEHRALADGDLDAIRVMVMLDAAIVVMPMTLTRMGWAFGRRR